MTAGDAGIDDRIGAVRARIDAACARSGRDPRDVTLIAVTKTHPASTIETAYRAGACDFGENRVQEAVPKIDALRAEGMTPVWHLIGHLQTNKVRAAIERFDILHGIDSTRLAEAVARHAQHPVRVLIEVNVAGESTKGGVALADAATLARAVSGMPELDLRGLMTVAPRADNPEDVRPVFRRLRELRDGLGLDELSMGMTDDFEVAVEEGATLVRVGRAIFGDRPAG
jgi:pyridoxal phosphate enzyme (YggS family)